ncbi:MAG: bifunctional pyr operon transcriptional regulator/uracil phosphoribosyltransferase PyrR [Bradymonadia bacterium]
MSDSRRAHLDLIRVVSSGSELQQMIECLADEVIGGCSDLSNLALIGIRSRGVPLAERLAEMISQRTSCDVDVGALDITLYRDDVFQGLAIPEVGVTEVPFEVDGKFVVLVDDVFFTGRTVRAALDAVMDFGRPRWLRLLVLVDRGHRELPIRPDYVGLTLETDQSESVEVKMLESDGEDRIAIFRRKGKPS